MKRALRLLVGMGIIFQLGIAADGGFDTKRRSVSALAVPLLLFASTSPDLSDCVTSASPTPRDISSQSATPPPRAGSAGVYEVRKNRKPGLPPRVPSSDSSPRKSAKYPETGDVFLVRLYELLERLSVPSECISLPTAGFYDIQFNYTSYRDMTLSSKGGDFFTADEMKTINNYGKVVCSSIKRLAEEMGLQDAVRVFVMESNLSPTRQMLSSSPKSPFRRTSSASPASLGSE